MNEVLEQIDRSGFDAGYSLAVEKLREYPNSDLLVNNLAAREKEEKRKSYWTAQSYLVEIRFR